jgi:hypothetical protein
MFVARMAHLGRSCRGGIPLHHGDRYARKTLEPLTIGERDGNMPQDRLTPPARRGPSAPSARNRSRQVPIRGFIALMALLAHLKLALLRLFTIPPVSHRDLVRLVRFVRTFLQTPLEARVPRDKHFKETDLHCLVLCLLVV